MPLNDELIKKILTKLNEIYPGKIEKFETLMEEILGYDDWEEVSLHLLHLESSGYVEFIDVTSKDGKDYLDIKLTPHGVEYLKSLS